MKVGKTFIQIVDNEQPVVVVATRPFPAASSRRSSAARSERGKKKEISFNSFQSASLTNLRHFACLPPAQRAASCMPSRREPLYCKDNCNASLRL